MVSHVMPSVGRSVTSAEHQAVSLLLPALPIQTGSIVTIGRQLSTVPPVAGYYVLCAVVTWSYHPHNTGGNRDSREFCLIHAPS